jgi:hypothetical protein
VRKANVRLDRLMGRFTVFTFLIAAFLCSATAQTYVVSSNTPGFVKGGRGLGRTRSIPDNFCHGLAENAAITNGSRSRSSTPVSRQPPKQSTR